MYSQPVWVLALHWVDCLHSVIGYLFDVLDSHIKCFFGVVHCFMIVIKQCNISANCIPFCLLLLCLYIDMHYIMNMFHELNPLKYTSFVDFPKQSEEYRK